MLLRYGVRSVIAQISAVGGIRILIMMSRQQCWEELSVLYVCSLDAKRLASRQSIAMMRHRYCDDENAI